MVCRLGGDEFLMFMPECGREELTEIVSGILRQFNENKEKDPEIRYASIQQVFVKQLKVLLLRSLIRRLIRHCIM